MLTKDFRRYYVQGTPGSPEIPAREAYTVCQVPETGYWAESCQRYEIYADTGVSWPPGGIIITVVDEWGYLVDIYYWACTSVWVSTTHLNDPVCVTYPAQPHVPAVPHVPSRWETEPLVGWDAGANSSQAHSGDCEAKWTMGMVVGAHIGLTDQLEDVTPPERLSHAFYFHQRAGKPYFRAVEAGAARSADSRYEAGDEFAIRRARGVVSYWHNGVKLQESIKKSDGEVRVGSAIYMSGDVLPSGAGGPDPKPDPDPGDDEFLGTIEGVVPPSFNSGWAVLPAGDYWAAEVADGASCDWGFYDEGENMLVSGIEGGDGGFILGVDQEIEVRVVAYQDGGPFAIELWRVGNGGA